VDRELPQRVFDDIPVYSFGLDINVSGTITLLSDIVDDGLVLL
jgi:hypothetical protein